MYLTSRGNHPALILLLLTLTSASFTSIRASPHPAGAAEESPGRKQHIRHSAGHSGARRSADESSPAAERSSPEEVMDDLLPQPGTYIPSNCSMCVRREEMRRHNLEMIKDQILNKLGLHAAPNMTGRHPPKIPPLNHLLDLYGMQGDDPLKSFQPGPVYDDEDDDYHARTEKVISFAQSLPDVEKSLVKMHSLHFQFSDKVTGNKADRAHLWVYLRPTPTTQTLTKDAHVWIYLYKVVRLIPGESPVLNQVRTTKVALQASGGWVSLEIRKLVADWFRWPDDNLGLAIQALDSQGDSLIVTDPNEGDGSLIPFVEVITSEGRKPRTKRTVGLNCDENSSETRCCRYPLTVDFVEFGWDWIIAPKRYEANYCSGECPYVFLQKYPHTHIVQQANPTGTAGPCCAPRKMSPISMLYFDSQYNIIYGLLPGMVVDRCGCS